MNFLEKDLEQIIFEADKEELQKKGLPVYGKLFRQLRIGSYGVADLVSFNRHQDGGYPRLSVTVYELKKEKIGISAFLQALQYVKGIERYLELRNFKFTVDFSIILIGKTIDINSSFCFLSDLIYNLSNDSFLNNYTYSYGLNGLEFKAEYGYKHTVEGFNLEDN